MHTTVFFDQFCDVTKSGDCLLNEDFVKFGLKDIKVKKYLSNLPYFWLPIGTKHRNLRFFFLLWILRDQPKFIFTFKKFIPKKNVV
jgi:hypothetical protein